LNPKKRIFVVIEGKLLGHILSNEGIVIDPERIETIMRIQPSANKKAMQSFFRRINIIRKIFSGFVEIVCPLQLMMKKDVVYKCSDEAKKHFSESRNPLLKFLYWSALISTRSYSCTLFPLICHMSQYSLRETTKETKSPFPT